MRLYSAHWKTLGISLSGLVLLGLAACDQQQERTQRAQDLGQAVLDQMFGTETPSQTRQLENVPVEARAMSGTIQAQSVPVLADPAARRYAIGSIVAKPRDLAPAIAMADVLAEPELADR